VENQWASESKWQRVGISWLSRRKEHEYGECDGKKRVGSSDLLRENNVKQKVGSSGLISKRWKAVDWGEKQGVVGRGLVGSSGLG
jgi:hypothetical protein